MIEVSNLRKYGTGEVTRLEADIAFHDMASPYPERTIYFEVADENAYMLADDSYDAFVLVPLWLAMLHKQTLHIRGKISKRLFQNIKWYIPKILCDFWDALSPAKLIVDGFTEVPEKRGKIIATGMSCGVDSLSTVYDHFVKESDPDYRINALFYFECGVLGQFGVDAQKMHELNLTRYAQAKQIADELGLPCHYLKSNVDTFRKLEDLTKANYLLVYSCVLSLSGAVSRYYLSNAVEYEQSKIFREHFHNNDMSEFCESYLVPLIGNERTDLIIDGCQYRRVDKVANIADWDVARKHLNVCWRYTPDGSNCGRCPKCFRTMLALEILGKLDNFAAVFDIDEYKRNSLGYKINCLKNYGKEVYDTENVDIAKEHNFPMPERREVYLLDGQAVLV